MNIMGNDKAKKISTLAESPNSELDRSKIISLR